MSDPDDHKSLIGGGKFARKFWLDMAPSISALITIVTIFLVIPGIIGNHNAVQVWVCIVIAFEGVLAQVYISEHKHEAFYRKRADDIDEKRRKLVKALRERADSGKKITYDDLSGL
ncbi:MAG TPA: hypothetical protein VLH38_00855 [Patescibacteria group bacterium]|nr:hypothetical protein [Patescibacteria group bacterium]